MARYLSAHSNHSFPGSDTTHDDSRRKPETISTHRYTTVATVKRRLAFHRLEAHTLVIVHPTISERPPFNRPSSMSGDEAEADEDDLARDDQPQIQPGQA